MTATSRHFLLVIAFSFIFSAADSSDECVYSLYIQTGAFVTAGTDSKISVEMGDKPGNRVWVPELRDWGLMNRDHDYFEGGKLDIFSVSGACLQQPLCRLNVTSDGSGHYPGWFCEFIEVTSTGPHQGCSQSIFHVNRWLSGDDLTVVFDVCEWVLKPGRPLVVRKPTVPSQ
ncbi:PREDICTED: PLAT domain-containing protein 3-like [Ipomoea nil]|uniref:PLAT domain-containing protein 3-like n=1 Tax=Ipomoea nil TaxID=35883 RepID=UPI000901C90A|nr:PREDICTED: PLAT domain-containing protein 3-like [Ipomoea nil]